MKLSLLFFFAVTSGVLVGSDSLSLVTKLDNSKKKSHYFVTPRIKITEGKTQCPYNCHFSLTLQKSSQDVVKWRKHIIAKHLPRKPDSFFDQDKKCHICQETARSYSGHLIQHISFIENDNAKGPGQINIKEMMPDNSKFAIIQHDPSTSKECMAINFLLNPAQE